MNQGADARLTEETTAGNYFVSNYPPYSYWNAEAVSQAHEALDRPPRPGAPLGIYLHIPFCRKRCHFCYFKVYTGKDASEIDRYLDAVVRELTLYGPKPFVGGRKPSFVYFGGGTPSYISTRQLSHLVDAMKRLFPWDRAEEITFECEPGTITEGKLEILKQIGVTRLSLGIENFDERILEANGRAHGAKEIDASYRFARAIGFPQINIDLIAGMMGETEENWRECVRKTVAMLPNSVTIYQMEVPYNTTISKEMRVLGQDVAPVASWPAKRRWVDYAFRELEKAGYTIASAYTAVLDPERTKFLYRDLLWTGADMMGLGVASFSHVNGTHFQNEHDWDPYIDRLHRGELPIYRALTPNDEERMIREFILQMKLGHVRTEYFEHKFGVDVRQRFAAPLGHLADEGFLRMEPDDLLLNRDGLLQVDRLLHDFFLPQHRGARYS
ncbi:MAG TPA: coproporphyrinogen-III oxidase family protein [Candidatus Acidoferrales bacterium]|nr:coproporphyrinogen-III oxidase family protein [Candidatus Acidoferrales bacterium]